MEILDPDGNPIPHLYGAGECGSFYAHLREGGGGTTECIIFGQIAGKNAASLKEPLPTYKGEYVQSHLVYTIGATTSDLEDKELQIELGENEYLGVSQNGMGGEIALKVKVTNGKIEDIQVVKENETASIGVPAFDKLIEQAIAQQSAEVEAVSGATVTSKAFSEALTDALTQAQMQ